MRLSLILSVVLTCGTLSSCEDWFGGSGVDEVSAQIQFENLSDEIVVLSYSNDYDSVFSVMDALGYYSTQNFIVIQKQETFDRIRYYSSYGGQESLSILVFKMGTMERYSIREMIDGDIYDRRYEFTYQELKEMGFKVTYTGD